MTKRVRAWLGSAGPLGAALALATACLAGCFSAGEPTVISSMAPAEATAAKPEISGDVSDAWRNPKNWPRRWGWSGAGSGSGGAGRQGLVQRVDGPIVPVRQDEDQRREVEQEMLNDISLLIATRGRGWFRRTGTLTVTGEGRGSFVFVIDHTAEPGRVKGPTEPAAYYKYVSGSRDESGETVRMQRTWFALYDPVGLGPLDQSPPRACPGVIVLTPGLFGTPVTTVNQTVHALRADGWAVLRMLAHSSRFTEQATFVLGDETEVDLLAKTIADELGDRAAECAFAVEDVMAAVLEERPALRGLPRVAVGMSGGAMVLPTIVARNPGAYGGAVLVAGGADYLGIGLRSSYADWIGALRFRSADGARLEGLPAERLVEAYRKRAPLDPLYTVAALAGKPVLMIHANGDSAVPADLGDELWRRAGRPERWEFRTGHEVLFLGLPAHLGRLNDWLRRNIAQRSGAGA